MLPHKTFSIIIPTFNNLELLIECITSIKKQSYKNYEVWIIDGLSTDGTQNFLKTLKAPFNFMSENDSGIYEAMNKGIEKSVGEWLYFMGADDRLYGNAVLQTIAENSESTSDVLTGNIIFERNINSKNFDIEIRNKSTLSSTLWFKNTIHHQGVFYNKRIFECRKYDETYAVLADYKLNLTLYKSQISVSHTHTTIAICGSKGISKTFEWRLYKEEIRLKTELSRRFLKPLFWLLGVSKFVKKNIFNKW